MEADARRIGLLHEDAGDLDLGFRISKFSRPASIVLSLDLVELLLGEESEVRRTRTDPVRRDTDRDGLPDGLELGVTRGVADPPGPVRGTAPARFRADGDPRTHTSPRRRDTDRDGVADGREDRDRDGRRDPGETDPRRRASR